MTLKELTEKINKIITLIPKLGDEKVEIIEDEIDPKTSRIEMTFVWHKD